MGVPIKNGVVANAEATVSAGNLHVDGSSVVQPVSISGTVPISGAVGISNFPTSQAVTGAFFQATQPISGTVTANLGTISGVATDANLDEKFGDLGQKNSTGSAPVVLASDQSAIPVSGTFFQATQPISGTVTANLGTIAGLVTDINLDEKFGDLGQKTSAGSAPVVLASDQASIPVAATISNFPGIQSVRGANLATYAASSAVFTPAAGDIFTVTGSATKIVKIVRVTLSGTATVAATINTISLLKRNTANTAGTFSAATKVPFDSLDAAATATVLSYTVAPTIGNLVGAFWAPRFTVPAPATIFNAGGSGAAVIFDLDLSEVLGGKLPTLRGISEVFAVNLSALPAGAANFQASVFWTEE